MNVGAPMDPRGDPNIDPTGRRWCNCLFAWIGTTGMRQKLIARDPDCATHKPLDNLPLLDDAPEGGWPWVVKP
jgi:hypothetical protein